MSCFKQATSCGQDVDASVFVASDVDCHVRNTRFDISHGMSFGLFCSRLLVSPALSAEILHNVLVSDNLSLTDVSTSCGRCVSDAVWGSKGYARKYPGVLLSSYCKPEMCVMQLHCKLQDANKIIVS
jgi:hypothetical protein